MNVRNQHRKSIVLFYILIGYVVAQISWWIFQIILLSKQMDDSGGMAQTKVRMLAGEFAVFFILLMTGVWFIHKVFRKEMKLSQSKKNFSLSVTHELKTPITTSKLYIETLQNRNLREEKKQEIYTKLYAEQNRLQSLIDQILLTSRVDSLQIQLSKTWIPAQGFVEELILKINLPQKIKLEIDPETQFLVDPFYFNSVLINLLENASKYSPSESRITVKVHKEGIGTKVLVTDRGLGIPNEEKNKIFQVYYRLENEELKNTKGTGLGLYLVMKIVELHQGRITVKDNPEGKGSIFEVFVPNK